MTTEKQTRRRFDLKLKNRIARKIVNGKPGTAEQLGKKLGIVPSVVSRWAHNYRKFGTADGYGKKQSTAKAPKAVAVQQPKVGYAKSSVKGALRALQSSEGQRESLIAAILGSLGGLSTDELRKVSKLVR